MNAIPALFSAALLDLPEGLLHVSQGAAATLVSEVWQGLVIAACLAICLKLAPRTTAAHRFGIWTAGMLTVAGLPFLPLLSRLIPGGASAVSTSLTGGAMRPWLELDARWTLVLTALWAGASLLRAADLAVHTHRLRKLWKSAKPVELSSAPSLAAALTVSGRKRVELCTTAELERPGVIGFLAPRILIPEWLFAVITPAELDQIVLHETEHLRRGDDWTNLLQKLTLVLFPLSPALLWIERRLCLEREMACDEGVVHQTQAPRAYAECLASLAERGLEHRTQGGAFGALSLGAWQRRPELVKRVHSILRRRQALSPAAARSLMAMMGCSLLAGAAGLARCPQVVAFMPPASQSAHAHEESTSRYAMLPDHSFTPAIRTVAVPTPIRGSQDRSYRRELKATMPLQSASLPREKAEPSAGTVNLRTAPAFSKRTVREEMLKADLPAGQITAQAQAGTETNPDANQGWIVLTTWEEVQNSDSSVASVISDSAASSEAAAAELAKQNVGQNPGQTNARTTFTRLIFRVIPVNSATGQLRSGWLVFQL